MGTRCECGEEASLHHLKGICWWYCPYCGREWDDGEEQESGMKACTVDGCWNCKHGGNLKILRTLLRSLEFEHGISLTARTKNEIAKKIQLDENRCEVDAQFQAESGFTCSKWVYDEGGFRSA